MDVAIHKIDGYPYDYHRLLYTFRVKSRTKDVGIYRPRHSWRFSGDVTFAKTRMPRVLDAAAGLEAFVRDAARRGPADRVHERCVRHPASRPPALPAGRAPAWRPAHRRPEFRRVGPPQQGTRPSDQSGRGARRGAGRAGLCRRGLDLRRRNAGGHHPPRAARRSREGGRLARRPDRGPGYRRRPAVGR